jgi:hypothetical protein
MANRSVITFSRKLVDTGYMKGNQGALTATVAVILFGILGSSAGILFFPTGSSLKCAQAGASRWAEYHFNRTWQALGSARWPIQGVHYSLMLQVIGPFARF